MAPKWLKPAGLTVALLLAAVFIAAVGYVIVSSVKPPTGYEQPRMHLNTKNTTRLGGSDLLSVSKEISTAAFPATNDQARPDTVILYPADDWEAGLMASTLLKPLNAVLLPAQDGIQEEVARLSPKGSEALDGTQLLTIGEEYKAGTGLESKTISKSEIAELRMEMGQQPKNAIIASKESPAKAVIAAPWAAYSGDLVLFDENEVPDGVTAYGLGTEINEGKAIKGSKPAELSVAFAKFTDSENPDFGWGFNGDSLTGYRGFSLASLQNPEMGLLSANLNTHGKPGPLLWSGQKTLPANVNDYLWSQRAAFWATPSEGPFHHTFVIGGEDQISFPAQSQADYAVEIGPYKMKGAGMSGLDMLASVWVALGIASAVWILFHEVKFLPYQSWVMRLAWPLLALTISIFALFIYIAAHNRPVTGNKKMTMWDRPLWLQGLVATASGVGFGGILMVLTGYFMTFFGLPVIQFDGPFFWLGAPMILVMGINFLAAVLIAWLFFQTPMLSMFYGKRYSENLGKALPVVLASMASVSLAMFPGMWWLMMSFSPMMPTEESILWFGVMNFTVFMGFLIAWPFNYLFVRKQVKSGLM